MINPLHSTPNVVLGDLFSLKTPTVPTIFQKTEIGATTLSFYIPAWKSGC